MGLCGTPLILISQEVLKKSIYKTSLKTAFVKLLPLFWGVIYFDDRDYYICFFKKLDKHFSEK